MTEKSDIENKLSKKELEKVLTEKQKIFCREYVIDWNGARAARKAGYSEDTAKEIASNNLTKVNIQAYISYLKENIEETVGISKIMILSELKKLAFSSIGNLHSDWITRKEFGELTDDQKSCIQVIDTKVLQKNIGTREEPEIVDVEYVNIKLFDKPKSIEIINKMMGYDAATNINLNTENIEFNIFPASKLKNEKRNGEQK
jgi:phage terminase small subunit